MAEFSFIIPCRILEWAPNPSVDRSVQLCYFFLISSSLLLLYSGYHLRVLITKQRKYLPIHIFCKKLTLVKFQVLTGSLSFLLFFSIHFLRSFSSSFFPRLLANSKDLLHVVWLRHFLFWLINYKLDTI